MAFFMSTWCGDSKNMEEIEFSRWLFEGRLRQGKNVLPDGLNWLCYFAGNSKSHHENSISFIFLESPHQVDMKDVVKSSKHFFWVFQYSRNSQWLSILTLFTLGWKVEGSDFVYSFWRWVHIGKKNFWDEAAFNYLQGLIHVLNSWLLLGLLLGLTYIYFLSLCLNT